MLPKQYRLKGSRIPDLISSGTRFHGKTLTLIVANNKENKTNSLLTVIIPVKLSKRAVKRNRTKRIIREALRSYVDRIKPEYEVIVMAKNLLAGKKPNDTLSELLELLKSAELLTK